MYGQPLNLERLLKDEILVFDKAKTHPDLFGIEIELEGVNVVTSAVHKYWALEKDGSLRSSIPSRNGGIGECCEYTSREPMTLAQTEEALHALLTFLSDKNVYESYRTSIHVHVNLCCETMRTVYNFITLAIIFDELFVELCAPHRQGNNFCLRFVDADAPINELCHSMSDFGNVYNYPAAMRYSSTNFAAIRKFGTVEFRALECTLNKARILNWVSVLQRLKEAARGFSSPSEIMSLFSMYTDQEFGERVLGPLFEPYSKVPDLGAMLKRGMRLAQDFAFSCTWVNKDTKSTPPPPQPKYFFDELPQFYEGDETPMIEDEDYEYIEVDDL